MTGTLPLQYLWAVGATVAVLTIFFLLRGRIRIEKGWAGFNIARFNGLERAAHWLLALSFLLLASSGLSARLGPAWLPSALGGEVLADVLRQGRALHRLAAIAFMAGLVLAFLLWVRHSLPHWRDALWLLQGGGMIVRGVHPAAWKFNLGQKLLFWLTMGAGVVLSASGLAMLFPGQAQLFAWLVAAPSLQAMSLPADPAVWHAAAALVLTCAVIIHIFLRTAGIEGAFAAMASGAVDANWARQHHRLWADSELRKVEVEALPEADSPHAAAAE